MKSFNKTIFPLLVLLLGMTLPLSAQQASDTDEQQVIIITKTIDDDGNEVVKKIVKKGAEATEYLDSKQIHVDAQDPSIYDVRVFKDCDKNPVTIDLKGMESVEHYFDINIDEDGEQKRIHIKGVDEYGERFDMEWEGEGEIPAEIRERMHSRDRASEHWAHRNEGGHGFLGVVMGKKVERVNGEETVTGESSLGIFVNEVVAGSGAEAAGLQAHDIITGINGQELKTIDQLTDEIQKQKAGDQIKVSYLRNDQAAEVTATLQGRHYKKSPRFEWHHYRGEDFRPAPCRPFIGVYLNLGNEESSGVAVQRVIPNTPASEVQLQEGDLITAIDQVTVGTHGELVVERDKHAPGDEFTLTFLREGISKTVSATFPACEEPRGMTKDQVIVIQKEEGGEEVENIEAPAEVNPFSVPESNLMLGNFQAFPNPTVGLVNVRFEAEAGPAVISVNDISGKEVYREELNTFDGVYNRQLDLSNATPGTLLLSIRQGDHIFTDKIILRKDN